MNKTVTVNGQQFKMYQASTGWVFVRSKKTGRTYPVAEIVDGNIAVIDQAPAISAATNEELAAAWVNEG